MIFYILPYSLIILLSILSLKIKGSGYKFLFLISLIPATLVVVLRGLTGTDTATYISILDQNIYDINENIRDIEPFFMLFAKIKYHLDLNAQLVLNFFSFLIILLLYSFFSKSKHRFLIFSFLIFPIFFYDMTMNGLRYGMAFALACYIIVEHNSFLYKLTKNKFLFIFCFLNHKSSIIFLIIKFMQNLNFRTFFLILVVFLTGFTFLNDYFIYKLTDYSELSSPSVFSGAQPLVLVTLILFFNSIFFKINLKRNLYLFLIQLAFYIVTQFSYAGIRFQFLELFYILVILTQDDDQVPNYKIYLSLLFVVGLLGFCLRLNNFYSDFGEGLSPFLPYAFYWEN